MKTVIDLVNLIKNKFSMRKDIAPVETSSTASRAYKAGEEFYYGNLLQRATQDIPQGSGLAGGVNFENADPVTTTIQNLSTVISKNGSKNICPFEGTISKSTSDTAADMIFYLDLKEGDKITYICNQDNAMTSNTRNSLQVTLNTDGNVAFRESTNTNYHLQSGLHVLQFTVPTTGRYNFSIWAHTLSTATTYSKFMVCDTDFYDLDPTYEPYAATNRQLTTDKVGMDLLSEVGAVNYAPINFTSQTDATAKIDYTVNSDKSIVVNATDSSGKALALSSQQITPLFTLKKGTYRLSGCPSGGSNTTYSLRLYTSASATIGNDEGNGFIFTLSVDTVVKMHIIIRSGAEIPSNLAFYPMITPPNYTGPYVPYAKSNKELTEATIPYSRAITWASDATPIAYTNSVILGTLVVVNASLYFTQNKTTNDTLFTTSYPPAGNARVPIFDTDGNMYVIDINRNTGVAYPTSAIPANKTLFINFAYTTTYQSR